MSCHTINRYPESGMLTSTPNRSILNGLPEKELGPEHETALGVRIQTKRDEDDMNTLALYNMREAFAYASACCKRRLSETEIFSLCFEALKKAAKNFVPGQIRFFAYAKPYVRGEICNTYDDLRVVRRGETELLAPDDIPGENEHTAEDDFDTCEVQTRDNHFHKEDVVDSDMEGIMNRDEWASIKPILSKLSEKERQVLDLRFQSGFNFRQIGELLNVSRSDTQATCVRALKKVRCELLRKRKLFNRDEVLRP